MKTLMQIAVVIALAATAALPAIRPSQEVPREFKSSQFMARKLEHSQKVLEGIVLEDFGLIKKNARTLELLSHAAEWQILPSAEYRMYSVEFRRIASQLAKMGDEENLDGAAMKYVELTLNCVNCHKHVRDVQWADQQPADPSKARLDPESEAH